MNRPTFRLAALALAALLLAGPAFAQEDEDDRRPPREDRFRDRDGGDRPLHQPMMEGGTAITLDDNNVYVVFGGTLFVIDKSTLKLIGQVELRREMRGPRAGGDVRRPPMGEGDREPPANGDRPEHDKK